MNLLSVAFLGRGFLAPYERFALECSVFSTLFCGIGLLVAPPPLWLQRATLFAWFVASVILTERLWDKAHRGRTLPTVRVL